MAESKVFVAKTQRNTHRMKNFDSFVLEVLNESLQTLSWQGLYLNSSWEIVTAEAFFKSNQSSSMRLLETPSQKECFVL